MISYRGKYIDGLMQPNHKADDYYDPENPFAGSNGDNPESFGSDPTSLAPSEPVEGPNNPIPTEPEMPETSPETQKPDTSSWNTDGYEKPSYTAESFGDAPSGWDTGKWKDVNHQTPKYVVGRILQGAGDLRDPNIRNKAISDIQKAYPGAQFNGKDKISIDGGKSWVDIFGGASAGTYSPAWQDESMGSGGGSAISGLMGGATGMPGLPQSATDETTAAEYNSLLRKYLKRRQTGAQPGMGR